MLSMKTTGYNSIKSWGIAVACGFINCMFQLPQRMSSILFVAFIRRYDTNRQNAALFITISQVLKCLAGPLTGFLGEIVDIRRLTLVGCLLASFGTGCCYLAENILVATIFLGLFYGIGLAIGQPLLPQILKQHFSKNIANANGISNGVSSGLSFAIIPLIAAVVNFYEVSGALLITSGIMLHCVPVAMLLKDPKYYNLHSSITAEISFKTETIPNALSENSVEFKDGIFDSANCGEHSYELIIDSQKNRGIIEESEETIESEASQLKKYVEYESNPPRIVVKQKAGVCDNDVVQEAAIIKKPLKEILQTTLYTPTRSALRVESNSKCKGKLDNTMSCDDTVLKQNIQTSAFEEDSKYVEAFKTMLVFRDPSFLVIVLCQSLFSYVSVFLYTIVIEISRDKGFPQSQEHYFLMFFPVAELLGHTCLGWVTDKGYLSVSNYTSICSLCMGMACVTFVLSDNYYLIMIAAMCFGLCFATIYSACPSLVYEFIEEKHHTMAIASRVVFYTPMVFTMAPLIGYFRGTLGSYDGAIYLLTGLCTGCSVLLLLLPSISKCSNRKK